ncbi:RagB/SusD family nutrient uptake outer membrane protein [Chitinophaga horti]|uniref:RagB/SusD family nutrient uptake outer membrane protein n=1 Tax=Chitinophaga horti TaxID=2920382 RepID=A0ABY6IUZ3_9BACT|nr:RagB/SusD family nutrient uptake outer membrane protein [Chitinophaga horti]UYQ91185.1 RagB/SusD family nutrient uptake outer membrane protein [Chitinophaga horti]
MKFSRQLLIYVLMVVAGSSCKDYLDVTPDNVATIDYAFRNRNEAENYLFTCYSTLQSMSNKIADPAFTTSGEIFFPSDLQEPTLGSDAAEAGFHLIQGRQTSDQPVMNYWNGESLGQPLYRAIRRCNLFLENIDKPKDLNSSEKRRWIAEVKFLKAYYHFHLLRMYGPIPVVRVNLPITAGAGEVRLKREPVDTVFSYVKQLLDEAAPDLPFVIQDPAQSLGRITQLIALSVKAEVLMTQASPFFNGNVDYAGFAYPGEAPLFPQTYVAAKWDTALNACRAAVEASEMAGLKLYKFIAPGNLPALPAPLKAVMDLRHAIGEKWEQNPEMIWALNPVFNLQGMCMPRVDDKMVANLGGAPGNFAVPLFMAELFYSKNGVPLNEDRSFDFRNRYSVETVTAADKYYMHEGYQTAKLHFGREPRFYSSLSFDGSNYFGNAYTENVEAMAYVNARGPSSTAGPKDKIRVNVTGYWPQKLVNYQSVFGEQVITVPVRIPMIRLAGLYLLYAEALNEVNGPSAEAYKYIDLVRERAGLQGVVQSWTTHSSNPGKANTKDGLRQIIQQERRIELAFEGRVGWDLRRWKVMQQVLANPIQGWDIYQADPQAYYRPRTLVVPVFGLKDYLWPIKYDELVVNPNLIQNPYW